MDMAKGRSKLENGEYYSLDYGTKGVIELGKWWFTIEWNEMNIKLEPDPLFDNKITYGNR